MKEKRKGVATSLLRVVRLTTAFELVPRASRASRLSSTHSCASSATLSCASQAQTLVRLSARNCASRVTLSQISLVCAASQAASGVRCFPSSLSLQSSHTTSLSSVLQPPRPALFWTRHTCSRQSGEDTPPLSLPLLASENRQMSRMSICWGGPRGRFGGKSRRGHAASPSVPRGA